MNNTFVKTLKFLSITGNLDTSGNPIMEPVERQASFYKLSQTDPRQAKLFFMLRPLYREMKVIGQDKATMIADPSIMYDLTLYAIDCLLIVDESGKDTGYKFTNTDKKEFLNDNFAVLAFGEWFLEDSLDFFVSYMMNYLSSVRTTKKL